MGDGYCLHGDFINGWLDDAGKTLLKAKGQEFHEDRRITRKREAVQHMQGQGCGPGERYQRLPQELGDDASYEEAIGCWLASRNMYYEAEFFHFYFLPYTTGSAIMRKGTQEWPRKFWRHLFALIIVL